MYPPPLLLPVLALAKVQTLIDSMASFVGQYVSGWGSSHLPNIDLFVSSSLSSSSPFRQPIVRGWPKLTLGAGSGVVTVI